MLSSKLGNSSELFSLSYENSKDRGKKVAGKKSYGMLDVSVQPTRKKIAFISQSERALSLRAVLMGLSPGTGKHCVFGHLGLVFIWSHFVFCLCFFCFT